MRMRAKALLCAVVLTLAGSVALSEERQYTVGDFAVDLARTITDKKYDREGAVAILHKIGVQFDADDLDAEVTEAYLVDGLSQFGVQLTTSVPARAVTRSTTYTVLHGFLARGAGGSFEKKGVPNFKCKKGSNKGSSCQSDGDCPGSFCWMPPGQKKKASPSVP